MTEYIEREAVINHLRECEGTPPEIAYTYPVYKDLEQFVESLPATDVAPVVHGAWEFSHTSSNGVAVVKCSNCGHEAFAMAIYVKEGHYCPYCGARMDKEEKKP